MAKKLSVKWSKRANDLMIDFPDKPDGHYIHGALCSERFNWDGSTRKSVVDELEARGYDITTLKFEVKMKEA